MLTNVRPNIKFSVSSEYLIKQQRTRYYKTHISNIFPRGGGGKGKEIEEIVKI